jgi:carbamoyl-phosphate synthase large subunit
MDSKNPTILVTAVSGDIGSSAVRSLKDKNIRVVGCDLNKLCPVHDMLSVFYESPSASLEDVFINFLLQVIKLEDVGFLLPISEPEIEVLNLKRALFEELGVKLLLNSNEIITNFMDKLNTVRYLERIGVKVPRTTLLREYDRSLRFPVIVKPRKGYGSKQIWKAEDIYDIEYLHRKDNGHLIVQELIGSDDDEYTTGVFSDGKHISNITFHRKLGYGGLSKEATFYENPILSDLAERIANAAKLIGSINIQSRRVDDIFIPFEINARLSSTLIFRKKFGFDDAGWWIDVLSGKEYSYRKKYTAGIAVRCVYEEYFGLEGGCI